MEKEYFGARMEIRSDRQAIVDGCVAVCEYEPETVKLDLGEFCVRLIGQNLRLVLLAEQSLLIEGRIDSVEYRC